MQEMWVQSLGGQDLGDDGEAEHHVQQGEEAEQVVHGLVQRGLQPDGDQKGGIGPYGPQGCLRRGVRASGPSQGRTGESGA